MKLSSLSLRDFRSYESGVFSFDDGVNIVCGDNGRGKTNLLEAIWLLTGLRSWRAAKKAELVRWNAPAAALRGQVDARGRQFDLLLEIPAGGKNTVSVNGVKKRRQLDLSDALRCVLFSPDDLFLVKGSAALRRDFLDAALCQMRPRYGELLSRYTRLLESKNRVLKGEQASRQAGLLPEYDLQLARVGAPLIGYRARFCRGLAEECAGLHQAISGGKEIFSLTYQTVKTVTDPFAPAETLFPQLLEDLERHRRAETESGCCLSGLHRDDVLLFINGRSARAYASQGQTRSMALALKFGQRELFYRDSGEYPVLLLDDVLSELDAPRQAFVAKHAMGGQSILTCCERRGEFDASNLILL